MSTREERLEYERRILAAEVETARLARHAKRFAEMIERNTKTLDAALIVANFDADRRGYDRLVVEPWMPVLASLLDDIAQILPDADNQKRLIPEKQPKSVVKNELFDLLEGLKEAWKTVDPAKADALAAGFARATGGVDVAWLIAQLGPLERASAIEARSAETTGSARKGESAAPQEDAQP